MDRRAGVYIPVIQALRDKITFVQAQLYNQPAVMATDNRCHSSGNPDYLVAMTDMLLKGFNVGGNANTSSAVAPGPGFVRRTVCLPGAPRSRNRLPANQQLAQAFNYMVKGTSYGGQYTLTSTYPALRGGMTWSINWDVYQNNNNFVNANRRVPRSAWARRQQRPYC